MVHNLLENRCIDGLAINKLLLCFHLKQIDSMSLLVCIVIDHRRLQYVVRTSVIYLTVPHAPFVLFSPHFDIICDILLNRAQL